MVVVLRNSNDYVTRLIGNGCHITWRGGWYWDRCVVGMWWGGVFLVWQYKWDAVVVMGINGTRPSESTYNTSLGGGVCDVGIALM